MWYLQQPRNKTYLHVFEALSSQNASRTIAEGLELGLASAKVLKSGQYQENPEVRRSTVGFFDPVKHAWLYTVVQDLGIPMNQKHFGFDLTGIQTLQFTEYLDTDEGHYGWHTDFDPNMQPRKLSVCIQLSDPATYEGGNLELMINGTMNVTGFRELGAATMFPSWVMHRVAPVTKGKRYSLVCWFVGPEFR